MLVAYSESIISFATLSCIDMAIHQLTILRIRNFVDAPFDWSPTPWDTTADSLFIIRGVRYEQFLQWEYSARTMVM